MGSFHSVKSTLGNRYVKLNKVFSKSDKYSKVRGVPPRLRARKIIISQEQ
jgi:hypothetical protein